MRGTERVDTAGENWMAPFGKALELDAEEFRPWKEMLFSRSECVLLVEGQIDKEYFELLRMPGHGGNRLAIDGEIIPYGGVGSLNNNVLLKFIRNRHKKFFVTYDLDAADSVEKALKALQLEKNKNYAGVGQSLAGRRNIEGLLPESVLRSVYEENVDLVQAAAHGTRDEQKHAKADLKRKYLEKFKALASPGSDYKRFYPLVRVINKALA